MTTADFSEVEALFQRARRMTGDSREEFLDESCAGRPDLRREVDTLLEAHEAPDDPLDGTALGADFSLSSETTAPDSVGRYRLLERIGEGGMGVVHLAEQEHPRRTVALKLIRPGFATGKSLKRFEQEAEALAKLHHEGIAQVFDAGVADGVPFLAMERVEGRPLIRYANEEALELRPRLELFARICDAVEHAHQHGVVHRDLKPSNILVEPGARPRILDFGVARFVDDDARTTTMRTGAGELIGTIQYMSPEQASGDPSQIDGRSDVYALGVLLFELLTDRLPYDLSGLLLPDAARVIREHDPTTLAAAQPDLRGDLDTVVGKALEKERDRRYVSAAALATDVRSFLAHEPITAHPPSTFYQLQKFARRHRALVSAALAVFAALVVGLVATGWQWREAVGARERAERRFEDVRGLAKTFIFDIADRIDALPGALDARRELIQIGLVYLDRLAREVDPDDELLLELVAGYTRIGDLQGARGRPNFRDLQGALKSYETALGFTHQLIARRPDDPQREADRIRMGLSIGDILAELGRAEESLARYREVRLDAERLVDAYPELDFERQVGTAESRLGSALLSLHRASEALPFFEAALGRSTRRLQAAPADRWVRRDVATDTFKRMVAEQSLGRLEDALRSGLRYVELTRAAFAEGPGPVARRDLAVGLARVGDVLIALDRPDEAVTPIAEAVALASERVQTEPNDAQAMLDLSTFQNRLGELALARGDFDAAERAFRSLHEIAAAIGAESDVPSQRRRYGVALYKLGELARARAAACDDEALQEGFLTDAARRLEESLVVFERMRAEGLLAASDEGVADEIRQEIAALRP